MVMKRIIKFSDHNVLSCLGLLRDPVRGSILSYILRCTHDLNKILDKDKATLLHKAPEWEDLGICQELLKKRANVNMTNILGETPLHIVARQQLKRNDEKSMHNKSQMYLVIRLLLHYGADIYIKNSNNQTVKDMFMENRDDYLKKLISINESNTSSKMIT